MENQPLHIPDLSPEFVFQASRSSGPGGQNVNKVNSRIELRFNISGSAILTEEQKQVLLEKLGTKLTTEGDLLITSQESRSQLMNKEACIRKLYALLEKSTYTPEKTKGHTANKGFG